MPVLQFRCRDCSAIFEYLLGATVDVDEVNCVSCGGVNFSRMDETCFYPNKTFCPHDKDLDSEKLKVAFSEIMADESQKCGGCGTDGSPGRCSTGGCGSGSCGCGRTGGCASKKINTFVTGLL